MPTIPFNRPVLTGTELTNIAQACADGALSGNGAFSKDCEKLLQQRTQTRRALLTHSCTGALEMAAILLDLQAGDEVILPAYTFVSTANAIAIRGAKPVFCDIRPDTLNIDERQVEALITPRTKSIWVVHYAGVSCEMTALLETAARHGLSVVEDAAQGMEAWYSGRALGSMGDFGTFSFHETKNVTCGEGGALLVNKPEYVARAEIVQEKGTDRRAFERGEVDKYTWRDIGSSFLLGELAAAFLKSQLDSASEITARRLQLWDQYHAALAPFEAAEHLTRPTIPKGCDHNAHMYYCLLAPHHDRGRVLSALRARGVHAVFHYVPLDTSPAGRKFTDGQAALPVTHDCASRLIRLPLYTDLSDEDQAFVIDQLQAVLLTA